MGYAINRVIEVVIPIPIPIPFPLAFEVAFVFSGEAWGFIDPPSLDPHPLAISYACPTKLPAPDFPSRGKVLRCSLRDPNRIHPIPQASTTARNQRRA
jgi:hypothetical protein